ncbi:MAG: DsbA family protein [Anaerolineales bacterium]|nr:DsbA family protein [Anaerolineales bacterium]
MSPEKMMSKRQTIRAKRQRQARMQRLGMIGIIVLGALLVAAALIFPNFRTNTEFTSRPNANDNVMGDPEAPITITEYSDYRCSHCGSFVFETEPLLIEDYIETGFVKFVYRSMGGWISEQSLLAAEATYCAGEENKFWEYHDILFANQGASLDMTNFMAWAGLIGLDEDAFRECMDERRYQARADQDAQDGNALGVQGTPTFFLTYSVGGVEQTRVIEGAQPFEAFQREIDAALAEMGTQ